MKITLAFSIIFFTSQCIVNAQSSGKNYPNIVYTKEAYADKLDSLRKLCGHRKKIPPEFELQTLLAISHYPDLYKARIKFKYSKTARLPIAARPSFVDFIHGCKGRRYKIVMRKGSRYVFSRSFNAQIGLIGHELAHIQFYRHKSTLGLVGVAFSYVFSKKYSWKFETDTDLRAIDFGFAYQLLEAPIYLNSQEIKAYMREKGYLEQEKKKNHR